jgi:hypothetical protein
VALDHFAESVFIAPGRCWRLVTDFAGRPEHCTEPVVAIGRHRLSGRDARVVRVWSCEGHREGLENPKPVNSRSELPGSSL